MDHVHYQLWLKGSEPGFLTIFLRPLFRPDAKAVTLFSGQNCLAIFSPKNVVMSTTFLGVVFLTCYFFPIFYVNAWGDDLTLPFDIFLNRLLPASPIFLETTSREPDVIFLWEFQIGLDIFHRIFKKKTGTCIWPYSIPPPPVFFGFNFWISANGRDIFPNEVCEVRRAHRTLSVLLFVPHALLCRQGGAGEWWTKSPNNSGVKHRWERNKKEWHKFLFTPEIGRMRMNSQEEM